MTTERPKEDVRLSDDARKRPQRRPFLDWLADLAFGQMGAGPGRAVLRLLAFVWAMMFLGLASLLVPVAGHLWNGERAEALTVLGVGLFLAGAATAMGSMLGFLFGVPKVAHTHAAEGDASGGPVYVPNTNLELISDWLTKVAYLYLPTLFAASKTPSSALSHHDA